MSATPPSSTYRLQVHHGFTLHDAAATLPYLRDLGVGAVYLSPVLQSTTGSAHGYDTTDVSRIDADRGGEAGLQAVFAAAAELGLGVVIDIVPNHLGIADAAQNPAWWDVLRLGRDSPYATWFDIDWSRDRILLPVLGDDQGLTVVDGELRYFEHRFPLAPGTWSAGDDPGEVHARQHYELAHWTRGNTELGYRRFFAVTTLAGVRVEDDEVFEATHARVRDWVQAGVTGLRVDHPDGLVDPQRYLERLQGLAPQAWITVEKILEPGEKLSPAWPVSGTTGYDAMREVGGLFLDPGAEAAMTETYQRLTGDRRTIAQHIETGKRMIVTDLLPAEVHRMAALVPDVANAAAALGEVAVAFSVYRSYLPEGTDHLDQALVLAAQHRPEVAATLEALQDRLHDPEDELARRMQQLSGATMAKGVEDTAFYRYARLVALNEVGGDPGRFGMGVEDFHAAQLTRLQEQPQSMTGLSTHDTKRGEDVRARSLALAEIVPEWSRFAEQFLDAAALPSAPFAYFLAQTFAGTGPIERARMHAYAEKAMREASVETTWTEPDEAYEADVHRTVDLAYDDPAVRAAWDALEERIVRAGWSNALGQKLLQLAMPGVPDLYQGTELWDDSLVDPDNRRPVDFDRRRQLLAGLASAPARLDESGTAKLRVTAEVLRARRARPDAFGSYRPVPASGPAARHLVGFDRGGAVALATRLPVALVAGGGWGDTSVTLDGPHRDMLTGRIWEGQVPVAEIFADLPVAFLLTASAH